MPTLSIVSGDTIQSLRDKLLSILEASGVEVDGELRGDTPLITSGALDSLGLFNLALFIESEIGRKVDIAAFDLAAEWNTINDITSFITTIRASK